MPLLDATMSEKSDETRCNRSIGPDPMSCLSDVRVISREDFEQLCKSYRAPLKSIVDARLDPKLSQRMDASDIVQEAFLEAFLRLEQYCRRKPMPFAEWLRATALQQLKIAIRKHKKTRMRSISREVSYERSSIHMLADQLTAVQPHADGRIQAGEQQELTRRALERLKPSDREVLLLRYVNELSNIEAAKLLGISETLASKRHCRALIRLQKEIVYLEENS